MGIMQALMGSYGSSAGATDGDSNWDDVMLLMDGSSSTVEQSSASNNPDSVVGTVSVSSITGPYGTTQDVLDFTSTADKRILFPIVSDLQIEDYGAGVSWTLETWIKTSDTGNIQKIFGIGNNVGNWSGVAGGEIELSLAFSNKVMFRWLDDNVKSTTTVADNNWHHVAVVYDGSSLTLYIDGTSEATTTTTIYSNSSGTAQIRLGDGYLPSQQGFYDYRGYMADFRITKGVARYTADFTPNTSPFPQSS